MAAVYALLGLLVGAFLNLCADRFSYRQQLSRLPLCPYCGKVRPWWAWISILAFLRLKPECPYCAAPISWRHPLVELGTAALFAYLWQRYGFTVPLIPYSSYSAILILIVVIDLEHRLVPNAIIYPAWGLALAGNLLYPISGSYSSALIGGAVGLGLLFLIYLIGKLFVKVMSKLQGKPIAETAFGLGDVRLGGFACLIVGVPQVFLAILLAVLLGGLAALLYWFVQAIVHRRYSPFTAIPYSPFLATGALITMFFGPDIMHWSAGG